MQCPTCGGTLRVYHTLQVRDDAVVRDHRCMLCRRVVPSVSFLVTSSGGLGELRRDVESGAVTIEKQDKPKA